ncbi:MAG: anhydro-N-acetylmuramic acid kinase [Halioglobus sp.]
MDAIDSAVLRCTQSGEVELIATREHALDAAVRHAIDAISHPGDNEIDRMGRLDRILGSLFAEATNLLLEQSGLSSADIVAIGSHGQTVRHRPPGAFPDAAESYTLQLGDPNTIAEETGITTIADFRRRDIAAGGEGAPLAPAFHAHAFGKQDADRAIVNIGGIANVTLLHGHELVRGFDIGPGNTLMDGWHSLHRGEALDRGGRWAGSGSVVTALLQALLEHPYFARTGPRSTGKEAFHLNWLNEVLADRQVPAEDVQATLLELTAITIANAIQQGQPTTETVYVCGGGVHNEVLMRRLEALLSPVPVASTAQLGIGPDWVEAATFAWLAYQTLQGKPGNAPVVTGAAGTRILGAIYQK